MSEQVLAADTSEHTYFAFSPTKQASPAPKHQLAELPEILCSRYRIERLLGVGGMSAVYRGRDLLREQFGEPAPFVALKTLSEDFAEYADASALLHSEFALTSRLYHRHIVRLYSFEVDPASHRAFIVMELLTGCTLDQLLLRHPQGLPWAQAKEISLALLEALAFAHSQGVIHGDIKPGNLMLGNEGIRLFDFGLGQAEEACLPGLPRLARDRFSAWTPRYAAPELLASAPLSQATDLFAAACVIYELFQGQHPYQRFDAKQAQEKRLVPQPPAEMPAPLWKVLRRALAFDVRYRGHSVAPLLAAFQAPQTPRTSFGRWRARLQTIICRNGHHV